ncbi:hypothetical protein ASZ90_016847 [hydrocarbon metagenome]|uniref:Uncharacterized protein n=1 Tax=hydrocarbon metagenome TaxID=938273 RepID=A0A0W8EAK9_9ZZZZ
MTNGALPTETANPSFIYIALYDAGKNVAVGISFGRGRGEVSGT